MDIKTISDIFLFCMNLKPQTIQRCAVGISNQVYLVECNYEKFIFRCCEDDRAYGDTIQLLTMLSTLQIPVPRVLHYGKHGKYSYLILNFIEGKDLGLVYPDLSMSEKMKLAKDVIDIQRKVSHLPLDQFDASWSWYSFLDEILERAEVRIRQNGYFDYQKVTQLKREMHLLDGYFASVQPIAYLDDISTKNLLVHNGRLSGIVDIDWIGIGDSLTFVALTYVALLNMDYETDYVNYLLIEMGCSAIERQVFLFYCLIYCVDFMGERGMQFGDKIIEVNDDIVRKLNRIYENLWEIWHKEIAQLAFL